MLRRLFVLVLVVFVAPKAVAADFRIETKIYSGDEEVPVSQNTTLFQAGVVYDFLESPPRVAIFRRGKDDQPGRFLLLDSNRSVQTEITTDRIDSAIQKLTRWSLQQNNPLLRFAAAPEFDESFDADTGALDLLSSHMSYRIETVTLDDPQVWRDLRRYLDAYAKLNCLLSSTMPPTARLRVNDVLERHNVIPVEVNLTVSNDDDTALRAEHHFTWLLSKDDRARIALVGEQLMSFRKVPNAEFRDGTMAAK